MMNTIRSKSVDNLPPMFIVTLGQIKIEAMCLYIIMC